MPRKSNRKKSRKLFKSRSSRSRNQSSNSQQPLNVGEPRRPTYTQQDDVMDYLSEDDEIGTQRYGCISFATITDDMKDEYYQQISDQLRKPLEDVKDIVTAWCSRENPKRAVKVRGTFKTLDQTYRRAEEIRNLDANFHIFTCEVGKWLPFDPDAGLLEDENYMEGQLNELLKGYKQNKLKNKQHYDQRKRDMMERAIQEGTSEGQQLLAQADKPIEAVKFEAEQAEETIVQLHERIKKLEHTKDVALKTLEIRKDEVLSLPSADEERVVADITVEELSETSISESQIQSVERDEIMGKIKHMRLIQDQSKDLETKDIAQELTRRNTPQIVSPPSPPPQLSPEQMASDSINPETQKMFGDDMLIPSQIRENYQNNGPTQETKREFKKE